MSGILSFALKISQKNEAITESRQRSEWSVLACQEVDLEIEIDMQKVY